MQSPYYYYFCQVQTFAFEKKIKKKFFLHQVLKKFYTEKIWFE